MTRRVADVYFSRFDALMTGNVLNVLQCMREGPCAQSSERYLAATIGYRNVTLCRFPPTGFLSCCQQHSLRSGDGPTDVL